MCWTVEGMHKHILKNTRADYNMPYVRQIMKEWGYTMNTPAGRHANRAGNRRIRRFQKAKSLESLAAQGCAIYVQDETVVIADDRLRKGVYTPKKKRAVYEYTGNHTKAMQFGLKAADGRVHIGRHDRFTKDEFIGFLRNARAKFGKMVMILDRAPQHATKAVQDAMDEMGGQIKMACLPPRVPGPQRHG